MSFEYRESVERDGEADTIARGWHTWGGFVKATKSDEHFEVEDIGA